MVFGSVKRNKNWYDDANRQLVSCFYLSALY